MLWVQRPSLHQLWPVFSSAQKEDKERRADRCVPFCLPKNCRIKGWVISLTLLMSCTPMARREEQQLSCTTREVLLRGDSTQQMSFSWLTQLHNLTGVNLRQMCPWHQEDELPQAMQGRSVTLLASLRRTRRNLLLSHSALLGCSANNKWLL